MEPEKLLTTVSEVTLIYRSKIPPSSRPQISTPKDSFDILLRHWDEEKIEFIEQFKTLYLNRNNRVLAINEISSGGLTGTVADPRVIIVTALKLNATALILAHNHPSGNLTPSEMDRNLTNKIKSAGSFLDIRLVDHIILSPYGFYSFADEGLL